MLYLLLAILCSVLLGFIFKLFGRFGVDSFQAIIFNYYTCIGCGWLHLGHFPMQVDAHVPWTPYALALGLVFFTGFNLAALTVRYFGVTVSQIMQKMSLLLSVPFAILMFGESSGWLKMLGLLLALAAIVLVNWPSRTAPLPAPAAGIPVPPANFQNGTPPPTFSWAGRWGLLLIPVLTWMLAGFLEMILIQVQKGRLADVSDPTFLCTAFGTAGTAGLLVATVGWLRGRMDFSWRNVVWGVILGVPNYGSLLFILLALESGLEGSFVFPVINVGIIAATTIGAVWLFQERLTFVNWVGIVLALAAIGLISG